MRMGTVSRPPAEEAGDEAQQPAHHRGQQHRAEADEERDVGAVAREQNRMGRIIR
jgi:hypothetical protein